MKLIELARIYRSVNDAFSTKFYNAEIVTEHDLIYIVLAEPKVFSDKDLELLEELGLQVEDTEGSDNQVVSFYMYI